MRLIEIGQQLRTLRIARGLTQAQLAALAGLTRGTVNRLENGTLNDVGAKKLLALMELVGAEVTVVPRQAPHRIDPIDRAVSAANVSSRGRLYADELVQALLTGAAAPHKAGHVQAALGELSADGLEDLARRVAELAGQPEKVSRALARLRALPAGSR